MAVASLPRNFRQILQSARGPCDSISLGQLLRNTKPDPASLIRAGRWLQGQLPVRFARRIEDFMLLPHVVVSNPQMNSVLHTYIETYDAVASFQEIQTVEHVDEFRELVMIHISKHGDGTRLIAEGYSQIRRNFPDISLDDFLHNLFTTRIATRILMENFSIMHTPQEGYIGVVRKGMKPLTIVQGLANDLTRLTRNIYGCSPKIEYRGNLDCTLDYIPRHVSYMLQEILKNALRATTERHRFRGSHEELPRVAVELQKGDVHVIIKISDQGGGMPKQMQREAWQYGWSTAREENEPGNNADPASFLGGGDVQALKTELAGFGFGLPLTRLHAQYFGGDVFMQALPGHGTDMYILLTHLKEGSASTEIEDAATVLETKRKTSF